MALVLVEGFDHLTAAELTSKSWSANPASMQPGRFDGQCARISATGGSTKLLPSTYSTLFTGVALRISAPPSSTQDLFIIQAGSTKACRIGVTSGGILTVRNSGGTVIATGTTVLGANIWNYIEAKVVINGASGTVTVNLNGGAEITVTTGNFGSTNVDTVGLPGSSGTGISNIDYDDLYALDTTGSAPRNTFLGDVRVETIYPTGAGAHTQWTPDSGSNYARVNEAQADGDTSYVSDATPGDLDSYLFGHIDGGATVYGVQTNLYARKDDASTRQIAPLTRQSSTDHIGTTVTLSSSYVIYTQLFNQDPTNSDWTATTINAEEWGIKEVA